jgi:hypothetical protein
MLLHPVDPVNPVEKILFFSVFLSAFAPGFYARQFDFSFNLP